MGYSNRKLRLGDILINQGYISQEQLADALKKQKKTKQRLGDYLVSEGIVFDGDIAKALHIQLGIDVVDLWDKKIPSEIIGLVSGSTLRKHNVLPIGFNKNTNELLLAMSDPLDMVAQDDISIITNCSIEPIISTSSEINAILDKYFGTDEAMSAAAQYSKEKEQRYGEADAIPAEQNADINNAPIVQLVRSIIEQAVRSRASDIHLDALERQIRVRYRVDGALVEKMNYDISLLPAIATRIKIMSGMDISEKRKPQDGRATMVIDKAEYDIRTSILPSYYGEKIVMRLANNNALTHKKSELGLKAEDVKKFDNIISRPNGIMLVTGPTGSGKSTTLYTALSELNTDEVNIITIEDPVEASIPRINQVQVNPKADLTFANALRSILRQDPDIIMIGEIRDYETASIAVQASITGHLVVSSLHTNSAVSSITRLMDMGIERYLIADSVAGIIAQRLVRRLCPRCKKKRSADESELQILGLCRDEPASIYEPCGCDYCGGIGYYGRIGVYEIMEINPVLRRTISEAGSTEEILKVALANGMRTLKMSASELVLEGTTSIAEMLKISI